MTISLRALFTMVAVVVASVVTPARGVGQPAPPAPHAEVARELEGRWELAIDRAEAQRRIERAIDAVTGQMIPIVSGIANGRLRADNPLSSIIAIAMPGDRIQVRFDDARFDTRAGYERTMPLPGQESMQVRVHQSLRGGSLVQVFTTDEGRRWNTLSLRDDGTLSFDVVVRSGRLPSDIRYQLPYRRAR